MGGVWEAGKSDFGWGVFSRGSAGNKVESGEFRDFFSPSPHRASREQAWLLAAQLIRMMKEFSPQIILLKDAAEVELHENPYLENDFASTEVPMDMGNKLQMKRKSRSLAGKQHEACGVWLDVSALKKRKLQNLIGKPALRIQSQPSSYNSASKVSFVRTKQTTISTFFRTRQAEESETDTSQSLCPVNTCSAADVRVPHFPVGEEDALPASVAQSIDTEKCSQQHAEKPQCHPARTRCDSHTRHHFTKGEDPLAEEAYPVSLDLTQPWEEKRILDHPLFSEPPLREKNGDWKREKLIPSSSPNSPKLKTLSSKKRAKSQRRYRSSGSENVNPQLEERVTPRRKPSESFRETASGLSLKSSHPTCTSDHWTENSQASVGSPLFTQDSEGYKVISHHFPPCCEISSPVASPPHKDCFGASYAVMLLQARPCLFSQTLVKESCSDLLFTEDSEGNKVIKH